MLSFFRELLFAPGPSVVGTPLLPIIVIVPLFASAFLRYSMEVGVVYDFDGLHRCLYLDGEEVAKDIIPVAAVASDGGLYIGAGKTQDS